MTRKALHNKWKITEIYLQTLHVVLALLIDIVLIAAEDLFTALFLVVIIIVTLLFGSFGSIGSLKAIKEKQKGRNDLLSALFDDTGI